ncbi:MFS-type transporter SLC18B1-like [Daktulosphaira vitifoliae]|uniref:MFS-type transporter SLC18B1-like n=1 Tax=Daktulosphaira vitifoliae TaxID=58002 RepID=UPI0021A9E53D|nr:MFS-type transporter SLC18B1-like [Daktulosphaira vitifoliae]XP_050541623.1 MFS-type transporter SLC18B1-like [Daktulosphaira vitifoliae]
MLRISNFSKRQWLTLIVFSIADFCNAICVSLQAPFYPLEAERKGATATEYGLVFGVFELVVFIISPIYGKHLNKIGPKYLFNGGIFTTGICAILFGFLDKVDGHYPFIILSFVIRIIEAMGNAAFLTASFAIIAMEFPDNVATTFASLETFFGLGLIVGPTVGGALYEIGGYVTPFLVLGSALFLSAVMTAFALPDHPNRRRDVPSDASLLKVLKIPGILLAAASIIVTSMSIGFLSATLEPHLRQFNLSPMVLGLMFVINGGTYALTAPWWGWLCDKIMPAKVVTLLGCIILMVGFSLIGPVPFLNRPTELTVTIIGLVLHGMGMGAQLVASFTDALRTAVQHGFSNSLETYGLISGLWTSTFALGAFIGPSVAGVLYDIVGFGTATVFVIVLSAMVGVSVSLFLMFSRPPRNIKDVHNLEELMDPVTKSAMENGSAAMSTGNGNGGYNGLMSAAMSCPVPTERPPGMDGIIACSSYKNRLGTWNRKESELIIGSSYVEENRGLLSP